MYITIGFDGNFAKRMQSYPYRQNNKILAPVNYCQVLDFRFTTETILSSKGIKVAKHDKAMKKKRRKVKKPDKLNKHDATLI